MKEHTWEEQKWKAWEAVEKSVLYDEHAEGCSEDEGSRLNEAADNALDELWTFASERAECKQCGLQARFARAIAQSTEAAIGGVVVELRAELMQEIFVATGKTAADAPKVVELIGRLMVAVRTLNKQPSVVGLTPAEGTRAGSNPAR